MVNSHKNHLVWNQQLNQNQTLMEQSLDGSLPKLCPAVTLSHQDGCHSAVALLLKAALIQVSDYRLLGASGLFFIIIFNYIPYNIPCLCFQSDLQCLWFPRLKGAHQNLCLKQCPNYSGSNKITLSTLAFNIYLFNFPLPTCNGRIMLSLGYSFINV